jgi:hypothetical protein
VKCRGRLSRAAVSKAAVNKAAASNMLTRMADKLPGGITSVTAKER